MTCQTGRVPPTENVQKVGEDQILTESVSPENNVDVVQGGLSVDSSGSAQFGELLEEVPEEVTESMVVPLQAEPGKPLEGSGSMTEGELLRDHFDDQRKLQTDLKVGESFMMRMVLFSLGKRHRL